MPKSHRTSILTVLTTLLALAALAAAAAPLALAGSVSDGEELTRFGSIGEGAGQLGLSLGIATDPVTGHVYATDEGTDRISEFTPWGEFVKAFGWDVAPGPVNEQQEVRVRAAAGQFKLSFGAESSANLPFDASGIEVEAALDGLVSIGPGGVSVREVAGTPNGVTPYIYVVSFTGSLAGTNVAELGAVNGTTPLSGGVPSSSLLVRTRADGTAGGSGLDSCTEESGCRAGLEGEGAGEFNLPWGVAVDASGDVYVKEIDNHRVQKFDPAGRFVLMFGGEVDKTTHANVCTAESGDECGIGIPGAGLGEFGEGFSSDVAPCPSGAIFVADKERIQRFNSEGEVEAQLPVAGEIVQGLACDPISGNVYATFEREANVRKLSSTTGSEIAPPLKGGGAIATDSTGDLFTIFEHKVFEYDSGGNPLSPPSCCEVNLPLGLEGLGTNAAGDLYVTNFSSGGDSFIRAFGQGPAGFESPPRVPPQISTEFASSVQVDRATVAAEINPHFWTDARYFVQYGTGKCSAGGCQEEAPLPPGALLTPKVFGSPVKTAGVSLVGLNPGTTYHYRFVAQSGGGGPVYGIDPDGEGPEEASVEEGEEAAFTTFPEALPAKPCPNDAFRIGPAARLPDCRAYEMVSPVNKNNGDIKTLLDGPGYDTRLSQSAEDGNKFTYSSYRGFGNLKAAPWVNQYIAARDPASGWSSESIDPAQGPAAAKTFNAFENPYKAFSADLCSSWLVVAAEPLLAAGAREGYSEPFRRDGCGEEAYEALAPAEPKVEVKLFFPELQGTSADGGKAILRVEDKLTSDATGGVFETYYASKGELQLLCILPSGVASKGNCSAGTGGLSAAQPDLSRLASVANAISKDGSRVYWTESLRFDKSLNNFVSTETGPGKVYLRLNPGQEQSALSGGECTEPEKACTIKVSETQTSQASRFLGASPDGATALFEVAEGTLEGKLYQFEVGGGSREIAGKVMGVAGTSEDLSRIYFVSEEAIAGTTGASVGKPNLYLDQEGANSFIATLSKADVTGRIPSDTITEPIFHAARASTDGGVLVFISTGSLTGYDNTDLASGEADSEVYVYEAGTPAPVCVSCDPSGARPSGGRMVPGTGNSSATLATAAGLAMADNELYTPHALSADGKHLFFNSFDSLLPRDTNGKEDVYEWESASSPAACERLGAELYVQAAAGCLSLISSGESPQDSELLDADPSGDDAFFTTNASLLPQDPGLIDVYDARAGGGFPQPVRSAACEGEACQQPLVPPTDATPTSMLFSGPGNLTPLLSTTKPVVKPAVKHCRKGTVRKRHRCVKKKRSARKRAARHARAGSSSPTAVKPSRRTPR